MGYRFPEGPTTTYKNQGHPLPAFYAYLAPISLHLEKLRITQEFWDDLIKRHTCIYILQYIIAILQADPGNFLLFLLEF